MQINYADIVPGSIASEYCALPTAERLAGLKGIALDLDVIRQCADRLATELMRDGASDHLLAESLTWHIVVRYARCFDAGSEGRRTHLSIDHLRRLREEQLILHRGLLARRDQTFAHAGVHMSYKTVIHLMPPTSEGEMQLLIGFDTESPGPIVDPDQATLIRNLAQALLKIVQELKETAAAALVKDIDAHRGEIVPRLARKKGTHANILQQAHAMLNRQAT